MNRIDYIEREHYMEAIIPHDVPDVFYHIEWLYPSLQYIDIGKPVCIVYEYDWDNHTSLVNQYFTAPVLAHHAGYVEHVAAPDFYNHRHLHPGDTLYRIHPFMPHGNHIDNETFFWYYNIFEIPFEFRLHIPPYVIVSRWIVPDGSLVMSHQSVLVVDCDNVEIELLAPKGGYLHIRRHRLFNDDFITNRELLAIISTDLPSDLSPDST